MSSKFQTIADRVLEGELISEKEALDILSSERGDLLDLVSAAYRIRHQYCGDEVIIHILNNVQNGLCPEDCRYCAQSSTSHAPITSYPMKTDAEIMAEAQAAWEQGAFRYCMVFSGTGPTDERVEHLCRIVKDIKKKWPLEVCVSPGVITRPQAEKLKSAGLDRLNHNLNTSENHYPKICSTHAYAERLATVRAAKESGLAVCSGVIVGMGESPRDIFQMAMAHRQLKTDSIPVNFLIPLEGIALKSDGSLTPEYCLRILCLFRFLNPRAEIRMAAGREIHLRSLEPLGLFAANSLFLQGYLNASGGSDRRTLQMIRDAGFSIKSEIKLDDLLLKDESSLNRDTFKDLKDLRPFLGEADQRSSGQCS